MVASKKINRKWKSANQNLIAIYQFSKVQLLSLFFFTSALFSSKQLKEESNSTGSHTDQALGSMTRKQKLDKAATDLEREVQCSQNQRGLKFLLLQLLAVSLDIGKIHMCIIFTNYKHTTTLTETVYWPGACSLQNTRCAFKQNKHFMLDCLWCKLGLSTDRLKMKSQ